MKTMIRFLIVSSFVLSQISMAQWVRIGLDTVTMTDYAEIGTNMFFSTWYHGILRSTDDGTNWTTTNSGLPEYPAVYTIASSGSNLFAGLFWDGVFLSTNNGASWEPVNTGLTNQSVSCLAVKGTNLFAGSRSVFISSNNGANWNETSLNNITVNSLRVQDANLFAACDGGVYLSANNGISWSRISNGLIGVDANSVNTICALGENLFAGTDGGVYMSTNNGANWSYAHLGPRVSSIVASGTNLFVGIIDGGYGIYLSTNNGTSWSGICEGLAYNTSIGCIKIVGKYIFTGTSDGVFRRQLSDFIMKVESASSVLPENHSLSQNYPNPFNPSTTIEYTIPQQSYVTLRVFDILGREVAVLVNEKKVAGRYSMQWNASALPDGIYFYRLQTGQFQETKRMILMK